MLLVCVRKVQVWTFAFLHAPILHGAFLNKEFVKPKS
jgi:hypothetical protein